MIVDLRWFTSRVSPVGWRLRFNDFTIDWPTKLLSGTALWLAIGALQQPAMAQSIIEYEKDIQPLLSKYCYKCHSSEEPNGKLNLAGLRTKSDVDKAYESWGRAVQLIREEKMPPSDEPAPTTTERELISSWYRSRFVENIVAQPAPFQVRRLSAREYRHTLRSLLGFDLMVNIIGAQETLTESSLVMKLVPTDPQGPSGYRNDTHANPLTTVAWDRYSQIVDSAILELFSPQRRVQLESLAGPLPGSGLNLANADQLLRGLFPRALRRPPPSERIDAAMARVQASPDLVGQLQFEIKSLLMAPDFLYRGLQVAGAPGQQQQQQQPVDDFELAERLSYFIWADMPDEELLHIAEKGALHQPHVFREQIERMLDSPKANNLAEDWAVQWLSLGEIDEVSTNVPLVTALKQQAIDFLRYLICEDRPLLEIIDSDVEFVNVHTERFYAGDKQQLTRYVRPKGIEVEIVPNQRIQLVNTVGRGGILTMPGILAMNHGPIIRGTWILEKILGERLPDPPANVGQVRPNKAGENLTFRQRFEQHRSQATCALCHDKIDPLGFALESYDEQGAFLLAANYKAPRQKKTGADLTEASTKTNLDTSGKLPSGEQFEDVEGLKEILKTTQRHTVVRNIVVQMLSYALCRKLEFYDQPTVDRITRHMLESQGTFRQLIHEIAASLPFREATFPGDKP